MSAWSKGGTGGPIYKRMKIGYERPNFLRHEETIMRRFAFALLLFAFFVGPAYGQEETVHRITVLGNVRVEEGVILAAIKSRVGRPFSAEQVREDLRSIFALGYFTDVQVDIQATPQGKDILFIVVERPSIREVIIKGNEKVKLDDIKEKVTLAPRSILNLEKIKENVEQIRKVYFSKGYYGVKVDTKIDYLETNEATVTFQITEGPKGSIKKIVFKGNEHIKSSDLEKVMATKEWDLLSFFTKSGTLDEDVLKNDIQILTAYYIDHGYLDVKISAPKVDFSDPKRIRIEIDITEGPRYRIGTIDFKGDVLTTKEDLFAMIAVKRNDTYSNSAIRKDIGALTELFADRGYAYVEITPEPSVDREKLLVDVTFTIRKGRRVSVEKIEIAGNTKTRDKVIRRELLVAEGELYSASALSKSRDRLRRLGFFKEVEFATSRGSLEDRINLDIKVEEAPTGSLSFGLAYSSLYGASITGSLGDRNLFGLGYNASVKGTLGQEVQDGRISFTDPYFLGYPYSVGTDIYRENVTYFTTYSFQVTGGDLRVGKSLSDTWRIDGMYKLETVDIYDVAIDASQDVKDQEGVATTSALSATLIGDTRDQYFAPTRGARHSFFLQAAGGLLGGDNDFVKGVFDTSWYFPLPFNCVLNLRGKLGAVQPYGGKETPLYEKFYVGGIATVRGYEYGRAGPIDPTSDDPDGAEKVLVFNSELIFPISKELGLRGAVFFDIGKGFNAFADLTPLKMGTGPGIRWFSPMGPIVIYLGFPINPGPGDKNRVFDFSVGTVF
jgi:outer membrane protein insertion porin family